MVRIALTLSQVELIATALQAVSPSGGGSTAYTLSRHLLQQGAGAQAPSPQQVVALQVTAARELPGLEQYSLPI